MKVGGGVARKCLDSVYALNARRAGLLFATSF